MMGEQVLKLKKKDATKWSVKTDESSRAYRQSDTQAEVTEVGKQLAENNETELTIYGRNGRIRQKNFYGPDNFPPKGRLMGKYKISVNQLASFSSGTPGSKLRIIRNQKIKSPSFFALIWYRMAKARITKSLKNNGDLEPILQGMAELKGRALTKPQQIANRNVSIEAMQRYLELQIPKLLTEQPYEVLPKPDIRSVYINGVEVLVSPEVILKFELNGTAYFGGAKIHIAKGDKFNKKQQRLVATAIHHYLESEIAGEDGVVLPQLCLSVDVFGEGIISAPEDYERYFMDLDIICEEIKKLWIAA